MDTSVTCFSEAFDRGDASIVYWNNVYSLPMIELNSELNCEIPTLYGSDAPVKV